MPSSDLREFLQQLETNNELRRVLAVDWNMEIGTIAELVNEREGHALLFDELKDYPAGYRVACGLISTPRRLALALGLIRSYLRSRTCHLGESFARWNLSNRFG
jgi:4-hydroxy-3-polyprenylbenzoate decarboxylase